MELMGLIAEWHIRWPLMELESVTEGPNDWPEVVLSADELMLQDFCNTILSEDLSVFLID